MKFLFDVFPVIMFFVSYKWAGSHTATAQQLIENYLSGLISGNTVSNEVAPIILATVVTIIASTMQISYLLLRKQKVDAMLWISFFIVSVFGSATIYFHSETFIKWKPTVIYVCYAASFLLSEYVFKQNLLKSAMGSQITMPDNVWKKLTLAWVGYFFVMGILNLYVAFNYETSTWVSYKLYSIVSLPIFIIGQSLILSKYMVDTPAEAP